MPNSDTQPADDERCKGCPARRAGGDALTGLADRSLFLDRLAQTVADGVAPPRGGGSDEAGTAVLMIDLDRFKAVNDSLGHAAGDALLRAAGGRIQMTIRETDLAARLGGDEFAVIVHHVGRDGITTIVERLVKLLASPFLVEGRSANVGASIGVALFNPGQGGDAAGLLRQADLAMYQAKRDGRNRFRFFAADMQARVDRRRTLESDLRAALALGQFELFYQPQMDIRRRRLVGFEALIRWRHDTRGLVPPDDFIPIAEELGLIAAIGEWVIENACAEAMTWPGELAVAVNVAADQFDNGRLVPCVESALRRSGLPGRRLELEITETVLLKKGRGTLEQLTALKALGVQISLDDFGTGYSSMTQLRSFPFDRVKIDRSFANDVAVVRAVAALGASLGMRTTAEGVETTEQFERLRSDGCTEAQGYLLSRPVPAAQVFRLIDHLAADLGGSPDTHVNSGQELVA